MSKKSQINRRITDTTKETKMCKKCGRPFNNRKRWQSRGIWDNVIYCSKKCRK